MAPGVAIARMNAAEKSIEHGERDQTTKEILF
jgi:hypothetical protein